MKAMQEQTIQEHYERLGLSVGASTDEIKAAYHKKLKEFPAHQYPEEFKAIRFAYEALRDQGSQTQIEEFFTKKPFEADFDPEALQLLRQQVKAALEVKLEDLIRLTF
jgi:curved DNA-binding protein CbpA